MSTASTPVEIDYPESDGQPLGETDLHIGWIIRLRDILKWQYREQNTYVAADLLVYYEAGNPRKFIVPDVFVVTDCDPHLRRVYKIWEEPSPPQVVFEITSRGSQREDTVFKPRVFDSIGVREYFLYDPTSDYLDPPLRGFRKADDDFCPIEPDADGWLISETLGLKLRLEGRSLVLQDLATEETLLTEGEFERRQREIEHHQREVERAAREAAEAEVARLRERLRQSGQDV